MDGYGGRSGSKVESFIFIFCCLEEIKICGLLRVFSWSGGLEVVIFME